MVTSDPQGTVYTKTEYDSLGRKKRVYNPTRCYPVESNCGESTWGYTDFEYDALGRISKVIPPDGSSGSNNVSTVYSGNCTTVTDQAGKQRKSCTDALGRLISVYEPDSSGALVADQLHLRRAHNSSPWSRAGRATALCSQLTSQLTRPPTPSRAPSPTVTTATAT
jgi:hypothetical protein